MENVKPRAEDNAPEIKATSFENEQEDAAALREVSEVRLDIESGTITLKLAAKK
jgi:hypothetical protein